MLDFVTLLEEIDTAMEKTFGELVPGLTFLHGLACELDGLTEEKIRIVESEGVLRQLPQISSYLSR
ncbi:MAG: hypothetical protein KJ808_00285 [Acidobacteria bacterium]|nr:hypothetical protein [Acidobacteriota bacterium]MBU4307848.1 hypothetical protein [Acidobacteriota bacterium]MBU4404444.1 hypothetical protein [Acidobacteriota bacterium]MCG2811380.1 hypothetical protein [Candidatus Aminicenantes bacterium]